MPARAVRTSAGRMSSAMLNEREALVIAKVDDDRCLELLKRMIATPSHNPPGDEADVVAGLTDALVSHGIEPTLDSLSERRPNLHAKVGSGRGPTVLLNGHTDTMPAGPGWDTDPYEPVLEGGRLYGLGSVDMGAGMAAMIEAVGAIRRSGIELTGTVLIDAVVNEENGGSGTTQAMARARMADWAVVVEPTDLRVCRLGNGQVNFDIDIEGVAGHGSTPEVGRNAISDAAAVVSAVEREAGELAEREFPLVGAASYNVGRVEGGTRTSIIPARCRIGLDRRISPGGTVDGAIREVETLLERVAIERPGMNWRLSTSVEYPPFETPESSPICSALRSTIHELGGPDLNFGGLRMTTDAVFIEAAGVPTIVCGPGDPALCHCANEYVDLEQTKLFTRALAISIVRLVG